MPTIKLLDKSVAELIAAGEVIERPSSVIKELIENSVDSGAKHITIEIKNGGISYMRITDDGCGIAFDEIPTAFLRHATSKIRTGEDLNSIDTMGFRGEALASVSAVARIEMLTRQHSEELGGSYKAQGGEMIEHERCGCPCGTTIIIRDLFYNTPARLKFLKKDVSEGNFISSVVDRLALSNPHISFRFIRDNKTVRLTSGDGSMHSAIRAVFGRQFSDSLVPVDYSFNKIEVTGYVSSPLFCRASRSMQTFFVNSRYIKNTTCMAALEEAYRNSMMVGKFPACVLNIKIAPDEVDVNVHPAKTEIRFAHEKPVFDAVYLAVKNALVNCANDKRQIELEGGRQKSTAYTNAQNYFSKNPQTIKVEQQGLTACSSERKSDISIQTVYDSNPIKQTAFNSPMAEYNVKNQVGERKPEYILPADTAVSAKNAENKLLKPDFEVLALHSDGVPLPTEAPAEVQPVPLVEAQPEYQDNAENGFKYISGAHAVRVKEIVPEQPEAEKEIRVIGEFAATYIVCEAEDELILIDKHAAHERIRFEKLKAEFYSSSQLLIDKTEIRLSAQEYNALNEYYSYVEQSGVELVFEDDCTVMITAMPSVITKCTPQEMVCEIAQRLINHSTEQSALFDDMLHTMACKSAIKANDRNDITELEALARRVYNDESIRFCPHGRPVMTALKKSRIEHFFSRTG